MEYQNNGLPHRGACPSVGLEAQAPIKFPDVRLHKPAPSDFDFNDALVQVNSGQTGLFPVQELKQVSVEAINGVSQAALTLGKNADAKIIFDGQVAEFQNILGVYQIGTTGEIQNPKIVFANTKMTVVGDLEMSEKSLKDDIYPNQTLIPGMKFGLFLIQDGVTQNPNLTLDQSSVLSFINKDTTKPAKIGDGSPPVLMLDGSTVVEGNIMHTADGDTKSRENPLNPGGHDQVASGRAVDVVTMGFEDLTIDKDKVMKDGDSAVDFGESDADFNDVVIKFDTDDAFYVFAGQSNARRMFDAEDSANPKDIVTGSEAFVKKLKELTDATVADLLGGRDVDGNETTAFGGSGTVKKRLGDDSDNHWLIAPENWLTTSENADDLTPSPLFNRAVKNIKDDVIKFGPPDAIIWAQGERDAFTFFETNSNKQQLALKDLTKEILFDPEPNPLTDSEDFESDKAGNTAKEIENIVKQVKLKYMDATEKIFEELRGENGLNDPDLPIYIQGLGRTGLTNENIDDFDKEGSTLLRPLTRAGAYRIIREAQEALANKLDNVFFVPTHDITDKLQDDLLHYTNAGYRQIADRLAEFITGDLTNSDATATAAVAQSTIVSEAATVAGVLSGSMLAPDSIADLAVWFDASDGTTVLDARDDGDVDHLGDKSGHGNDARQSLDLRQPDIAPGGINGRDAFRFDGSHDRLHVADSDGLNTADSYDGKTLLMSVQTGLDVNGRQVLFEEGGHLRGLNVYVDDGELYVNAWNLAETAWGPKSVSASVSAGTAYVVALVFDAAAGTVEGFLDGQSMGVVAGADLLHSHSNDIGIGAVIENSYFHDGVFWGDGLN